MVVAAAVVIGSWGPWAANLSPSPMDGIQTAPGKATLGLGIAAWLCAFIAYTNTARRFLTLITLLFMAASTGIGTFALLDIKGVVEAFLAPAIVVDLSVRVDWGLVLTAAAGWLGIAVALVAATGATKPR